MTAVMLTGVMLLQVNTLTPSHPKQTHQQAGRYYAKRSSNAVPALAQPATLDDMSAASPNNEAVRRSGTPYRELTEEEALEMRSL